MASSCTKPFRVEHGTSAENLAVTSTIQDIQTHSALGGWERWEEGRSSSGELPSLILESDIIDITSYSEVNTRDKIDVFIDTLESIRVNKAA